MPASPFQRRRWRFQKRPRGLPRYWRDVTDAGDASVRLRFREQLLVLNARAIACKTVVIANRPRLYVPPMLEGIARRELAEFREERRPIAPAPPPPPAPHAWLAVLALLPLAVWHGWREGWWSAPACLPHPALWAGAGQLDSVRIPIFHEWQRLVTSLTLHADVAHLCGNLVFGGIFLLLLARATGWGRAVWLSVLGGTLGNGLSLLLRHAAVQSMGFSTALFACVGCLAGYGAGRGRRRQALLPVAAGAALLAMLGTEGERTDYAAHVAGLACGLALGWWEAWRRARGLRAPGQGVSLGLAVALPVAAWWRAFVGLG